MDVAPTLIIDRKDATMKNATVIDFIAYRKQRFNKADSLASVISEELVMEIKNLIERLRKNQPQHSKM